MRGNEPSKISQLRQRTKRQKATPSAPERFTRKRVLGHWIQRRCFAQVHAATATTSTRNRGADSNRVTVRMHQKACDLVIGEGFIGRAAGGTVWALAWTAGVMEL